MKYQCLILCFLLVHKISAIAQNSWLPSVTFPVGTHLCDTAEWKLLFSDDFNGTTLGPEWITFKSWAGMPGGDHEDWGLARANDANMIFRKENVIVENGTCQLIIKNEPSRWHCNTCSMDTFYANLTGGMIALPYNKFSFHSGKFEARIRFPVFRGCWNAFWLWNGAGVNEIDIAESIGGTKPWPYLGTKAHNKTTYSLHAWGPDESRGEPNPLHVVRHAEQTGQYPDQSWWGYFKGKHFRQDDWHVYTCEWDSSVISFYMDDNLINRYWKYQRQNTGSTCTPAAGSWNVLWGFPYNNLSYSQLRLTTGMLPAFKGNPDAVYELGRMEIDYVKVWLRHAGDRNSTQ